MRRHDISVSLRTGKAVGSKLEVGNEDGNVESGGSEFVAAHRHGADPPASLQRPNVNPLFEKALERLALRSACEGSREGRGRLWDDVNRGRRFVESYVIQSGEVWELFLSMERRTTSKAVSRSHQRRRRRRERVRTWKDVNSFLSTVVAVE